MKLPVQKLKLNNSQKSILKLACFRNRVIIQTNQQDRVLVWLASMKRPSKIIQEFKPRSVQLLFRKGCLEEIPTDTRYFKLATTTFYRVSELGRLTVDQRLRD